MPTYGREEGRSVWERKGKEVPKGEEGIDLDQTLSKL